MWPVFNSKPPSYLCAMQILCCAVHWLRLISQIIELLARPWAGPNTFLQAGISSSWVIQSTNKSAEAFGLLVYFPVQVQLSQSQNLFLLKDMSSGSHVEHSQRFASFTFIRTWVRNMYCSALAIISAGRDFSPKCRNGKRSVTLFCWFLEILISKGFQINHIFTHPHECMSVDM